MVSHMWRSSRSHFRVLRGSASACSGHGPRRGARCSNSAFPPARSARLADRSWRSSSRRWSPRWWSSRGGRCRGFQRHAVDVRRACSPRRRAASRSIWRRVAMGRSAGVRRLDGDGRGAERARRRDVDAARLVGQEHRDSMGCDRRWQLNGARNVAIVNSRFTGYVGVDTPSGQEPRVCGPRHVR